MSEDGTKPGGGASAVMPDAMRISSRSRGLLSMLKSRTGLRQASAARLAFCLSVADPTVPEASAYDENGPELRTSDIFGGGECADAYSALLAYVVRGDAGPDAASDFLRAHVNRGITMLFSRARTISDVGMLVAGTGVQEEAS
ncbi:MAG: DndE family protein [Nitrosopumilaceae archaeon]|nr:DndE family protein [Nitrosopumilaceae archaeon]